MLNKDFELDSWRHMVELVSKRHLEALRLAGAGRCQSISSQLAVGRIRLRLKHIEDERGARQQTAANRDGDIVLSRRARHPFDRVSPVQVVSYSCMRARRSSDVDEEEVTTLGEALASFVEGLDTESHHVVHGPYGRLDARDDRRLGRGRHSSGQMQSGRAM